MPKKTKTTSKTALATQEKKERVTKDVVIRARVTTEERDRFEKKAKELKFSTVSEVLRSLIAEKEIESED